MDSLSLRLILSVVAYLVALLSAAITRSKFMAILAVAFAVDFAAIRILIKLNQILEVLYV